MRLTSQDWLQAQNSVLGAALLDEKIAVRVLTETEERDYSGPCLTVFCVMRKLFLQGRPLDPVSIRAELGDDYSSFLAQLMELSPTAANVDHHIQLCREQSRVLSIRDLAQQLLEADTKDAVQQLLDQANSLMVTRQALRPVTMADGLKSFMDRPGKKVRFLSWPFPGFNDFLRIKPGRFVIFGAEPSVGKTAFSLQCAWHWAREYKVGFFSLETDPETLFDRLIAHVARVPMPTIQENRLSEEEWARVCQATQDITSRRLELIPTAGLSTSDIRAKIIEGGYQIVVIDYLQLIPAAGSSRYEKVTSISIDLHTMAQSLGVTVVALSQLSRSDDDHTPKNSDLRESGQLEQDADVIIMLKLEKQSEPAGPRKVFVTKNKDGELFMSVLAFDGKHQTFSKASRTGEVVSKYVYEGKKAQRQNRNTAPAPDMQMTMLPDNTPVPF